MLEVPPTPEGDSKVTTRLDEAKRTLQRLFDDPSAASDAVLDGLTLNFHEDQESGVLPPGSVAELDRNIAVIRSLHQLQRLRIVE